MKLKTFAILLISVCILAAVVLLTFRTRKDEHPSMGAMLFTDLATGDIARITITSPDAASRIKQTPGGWTVENRFDYPADFSKVAELVQKISNAKIGRTFPVSPEIQDRLALLPPEQPETPADRKGTRIVLADKDAKKLADLIIGKPREGAAGKASDTYYVMRLPENQVYLIDQNFRFLEKKPAGWLNKKPIDLNPKRIWKVVCFDTRTGRRIYTLERPAEDKEPVLSGLPAGKKTAKIKADQVFEALSSLTIEDVVDPGRKDADTRFRGAPRFDYYLYDGTFYQVFPGSALKDGSEQHYFRVAVSYGKPPGKGDPLEQESQAKMTQAAEKLNLQISPWTYVISKWVYDSFINDPQNLIEKEDKK